MLNKLRKICTHHRLEDRLRGTTRTNHRGYHTPIPNHRAISCRLPEVHAVGKPLGRKLAWWISKIATNHFNYQPNHNSRVKNLRACTYHNLCYDEQHIVGGLCRWKILRRTCRQAAADERLPESEQGEAVGWLPQGGGIARRLTPHPKKSLPVFSRANTKRLPEDHAQTEGAR